MLIFGMSLSIVLQYAAEMRCKIGIKQSWLNQVDECEYWPRYFLPNNYPTRRKKKVDALVCLGFHKAKEYFIKTDDISSVENQLPLALFSLVHIGPN